LVTLQRLVARIGIVSYETASALPGCAIGWIKNGVDGRVERRIEK
jgi:hypothetical protein